MTVTSTVNRNDYTGNGVTVDFPVTFRFLENSHLRVLRTVIATNATTELVLDSLGPDGFSVEGAGQPSGGMVTVVTPPANNTERLSILRNVPITQEIDYIANDPFPAESHERGLDKLTMIVGQQGEVVDRAVVLPPQTTGVSNELPGPVALNLLRWKADLSGLENAVPPAIATVADGAVVDATVSPIAAIQGTKLKFRQSGAGSVDRTVQDKQRERITPYDKGAVGDGITDDRAALIAADAEAAARGMPLILPYGNFLVSAPIGGLLASWIGEMGATVTAANTVTLNGGAFLQWLPATGLRFAGVTVQFNSRPVTVGSEAVIAFVNPTDITVERCRILNLTGCGITMNGPRNFVIKDNYISRAVMSNSYNQAILVSSSSRSSFNGKVTGNTCDKSGMDFSCTDTTIDDNDVFGWGFGAGVTTEQDVANSARYTISNNRLRGGVGIDTNATRPMGIENWGPQSVIKGNICYNNSGNGIVNGGQNTVVDSNICFNNALSAPDPGIVSRYANATFNANGSIYSNNKCFDTQGTHTQTYGYYDNSTSLTNITLIGNEFNGNHLTAPELVQGSVCKYTGPSLEFTNAWAPPTVSNNSTATRVVSCGGASLGDFVAVSYSGSLNGLSLSGYVDSLNSVTIVLTNNSGVAYQPPTGTFRIRVTKPKNYAAY